MNLFKEKFRETNLDIQDLIGVYIDGVRFMKEKKVGFVSLLQKELQIKLHLCLFMVFYNRKPCVLNLLS